jgi:LacI family transcriptional regulator, galactose operon repressor
MAAGKSMRSGIPRIAELAGVSIGTVDRALHGRLGINEATRQRVLAVAKQIGYRPNLAARSLSTKRAIRIGICVPKEIRYFYNELWDGIREEMRRYSGRGVEFILRPLAELGCGDRAGLRALLSEEVHGIVLTPGTPELDTPLIDMAEEAGVRVVCVSTDAPQSKRSTIVCIEPRLNGLIAGELMANFVGHNAKVAIITGMLRTIDHREKAAGFAESFTCITGGEILSTIEAHESATESYEKTLRLLSEEQQLSGIYVNTVNCLPVCRALLKKKRTGKVKLIATDLFREMVPHIRSGTIVASIHQRPYRQGQLAIRTLAEHLLHAASLPPSHYLSPGIVLRSNLHLFREAAAAE